MILSTTQRTLIERVINTIETGKPAGDYSNISIFADGPHDVRQITYGRAQTTEYGNLRKLIIMYSEENGIHSLNLKPYIDKIGSSPLVNDATFKKLIREAGRNDPIMRKIQDKFFEEVYFLPAMKWADDNGFTLALSALVIYDSYIHSGQILWIIRNMFAESPPAAGGNEKNGFVITSMLVMIGLLIIIDQPFGKAFIVPRLLKIKLQKATGISKLFQSRQMVQTYFLDHKMVLTKMILFTSFS